jgi:glycosyltransferase involved in cell wall biosynthesis/ribosomal protein S18 acetylase RimI-like enzyme
MSTQEKNPIRVLHVIGESRFGGIARIILGLGRVAREEGWEIDVLTTDPNVQRVLGEAGLGVVPLDVIRREIRPLWDMAGMFRLLDHLRRERYQIVHTHTSKGGFVGRMAASLAHVPVIIHSVHGFAFHEASPPSTRYFYTALERLAARWCDRIVSVSEFHRDWALELRICEPRDILAIPNGISPLRDCDPSAAAELRRHLGLRPSDVLVLTTSRLAEDKGLHHLIEAAALLPQGERRYKVAIAGDGPMRDRLMRLASERASDVVTFLGFRRDISELLAACDIVALPSLREGLSIAALEAMAARKPIVATSIGSHRELASQGDIARLVAPADPHALADGIQRLSADPWLMAHLAKGAHDLYRRRYTEDRMLEGYRGLYLELLEQKTSIKTSAVIVSSPHRVRRAGADDLAGIVAIHQKAFSQFFLTRLGAEFLRLYYELVLNYHAGIVLVSESRGALDGFVCGFVDPAEFYRLMWRNKHHFALPALSGLIRHPSLAARILYGVRRIQSSASQGPPRSSELSSIAVAPHALGNGLGKTLVHAFLEQSWSMDAQCVYLTTDADGNEQANALYRAAGFQHVSRFLQRKGRWMNEYVIHREARQRRQEDYCGVLS